MYSSTLTPPTTTGDQGHTATNLSRNQAQCTLNNHNHCYSTTDGLHVISKYHCQDVLYCFLLTACTVSLHRMISAFASSYTQAKAGVMKHCMHILIPHTCTVNEGGCRAVNVHDCWHGGRNQCACVNTECNACMRSPIIVQEREELTHSNLSKQHISTYSSASSLLGPSSVN